MTQDELRHFVTDTLGCRCPAKVLDDIISETALSAGPLYRALAAADETLPPVADRIISVGGRLLVLVSRTRDPERISRLLSAGVRLRDRMNYNRFRLVVAAPQTGAPDTETMLSRFDDRVHVHVVTPPGPAADC